MKVPKLIRDHNDLNENLDKIESYLNADAIEDDFNEMVEYIRRGHNFVCYRVGDKHHFAPSRFVGYKSNTLSKHKGYRNNRLVTGTDTDRVLSANYLLGKPIIDEEVDRYYISFCKSLDIQPLNRGRKYWMHNEDIEPDMKSSPYVEGSTDLRIHKFKERNRKVVELAKKEFKIKHGKLFCEKCGFCFEDVYGELGKDFIEAHHKIPLSQFNKKHEVSVGDFMMVCSNCHSMLHQKGNQNDNILI